ncbi:MAG: spore cortex biosynthesis protein YabQ, partial [Bacillota bacterium]|nr:spore cortex biosynthesis protein YabQ [Bacillota bacterium]
MTELITEQIFHVLVMFGGGAILMTFWELLAVWRVRRKPGRLLSFCQELCYWVLAALLVSAFFYYCSHGALSVHGFLALGAGALFWKWFSVNKISRSFSFIYGIMSPVMRVGKHSELHHNLPQNSKRT